MRTGWYERLPVFCRNCNPASGQSLETVSGSVASILRAAPSATFRLSSKNSLFILQVPSIPPRTYSLPLNGRAPIPQSGPPVPLVVTAIDANGSPAYVYPITNQGVTVTDPILAALNQGNPSGPMRIVDSRIKAAFAQFLWLRHGGSGYLFGFGDGAVGQNGAVNSLDCRSENTLLVGEAANMRVQKLTLR